LKPVEDAAADTARAFNDAINAGDLDRLCALMSPDHRFVDSAGGTAVGRAACRSAWASFFDSFPDYRNVPEHIDVVEPGRVVIDGRSECSFEPLRGPARWHALVVDGAIAEWRVEEPHA
jgi:ketosteroid isomerase-like protein